MAEIGQKGLKFAFFGKKTAILNFPEPPVKKNNKKNFFLSKFITLLMTQILFYIHKTPFCGQTNTFKKIRFFIFPIIP